MNKINFHLPGAFEYFQIYEWLIPTFFNNTKIFYDFVNIYCVYGSPLYFPWSGGRSGYPINEYSKYTDVKEFYKSYNIPISIVASNLLLTETDLYDRYCNKVLEYYDEPGNSVIVSNELLHKHIRKNYKNYLLISSTTKCLNAEETKKEYNNDYDLVVLDYNLNNDWDFLNSLNEEEKSKTEFLINHDCGIKCPRRKQHYITISQINLFQTENSLYDFSKCKWQGIPFYDSIKRPYILTINRIQNEYLPKGFTHFKIEGRNRSNLNIIYPLVHYLVKPEYHEEAIYNFLYYLERFQKN